MTPEEKLINVVGIFNHRGILVEKVPEGFMLHGKFFLTINLLDEYLNKVFSKWSKKINHESNL